MRLQVYLVKDNSATVCAYDLDNDGRLELVRIASGGSGQCSSELYAEAPDKPYRARRLAGKQSVLLQVSQLPEAWRARYETVVLRTLQQKRAD